MPNDILTLFMSFERAMRHDLNSGMPDTCSFMHVKALQFVAERGSPSMSEIADELRITSPGTTVIVDKLVELGDLARAADDADRRVVRLKITARGKKTLEKGLKEIERKISARLSILTAADRTHFTAILKKLISSPSI